MDQDRSTPAEAEAVPTTASAPMQTRPSPTTTAYQSGKSIYSIVKIRLFYTINSRKGRLKEFENLTEFYEEPNRIYKKGKKLGFFLMLNALVFIKQSLSK